MAGTAKPRRKVAARGHKLPEDIPESFVITDTTKKSWTFGKEIGFGGFGTVYYAAEAKSPKLFDFVVKVEYHGSGPLFTEMHCYQKIAKPSQISDWTKQKRLSYLGISACCGTGSFEFGGAKYRFMVIERFGTDLQKMLNENGKTFPTKTAFLVSLSVLNVLEYMHNCEYVHGDIKAANLLLGRKRGTEDQVYLVDMGMACRYSIDGVHKKDAFDAKKAHNGTIEFASRDAHLGKFSRRSDLEILCFNLLQWLTNNLPWLHCKTPQQAQKLKNKYMDDVPALIKHVFPDGNCPSGVVELVEYVAELEFTEPIDYDFCKKQLQGGLKKIGAKGTTLDFKTVALPPAKKSAATSSSSSSGQPAALSNKENVKSKSLPNKRKEKAGVYLAPDIVPTPAMLAVLNKNAATEERPKKTTKKK